MQISMSYSTCVAHSMIDCAVCIYKKFSIFKFDTRLLREGERERESSYCINDPCYFTLFSSSFFPDSAQKNSRKPTVKQIRKNKKGLPKIITSEVERTEMV